MSLRLGSTVIAGRGAAGAGGGSASFNGINGQTITVNGEVSSIEGEVGTLTAYDSGTFANIQFSTETRTSATLTITLYKNSTSVASGTITSATSVTNDRYYGSITTTASFVDTDVIRYDVSDTGTGSTGLVINTK